MLKIKKIYLVLKTKGLTGLFKIVYKRLFIKKLVHYKKFKEFFTNRVGLEIGGPSGVFGERGVFPVYSIVRRVDNCNFCNETIWEGVIKEGQTFKFNNKHNPGYQYIREATDLYNIESHSYDFLLSSHTLEHTANPLKALLEWIRVLKKDGLLVLILPNKQYTFDHRRSVTSMKHLIKDFENQTKEDDTTHLDEILKLHDFSKDLSSGGFDSFKKRVKDNINNRSMHHHVFDVSLTKKLINYVNLEIIIADTFPPYNILIIARKR